VSEAPQRPSGASASLYRVIALTILVHVAFAGSRVAVSLYALSLGATALAVGTALSLYAALPMLFSVQAGRWIDRIGPRRPMLLAAAVTAAGSVVPLIDASVTPLFLTAALVGSGFMLFHIAATQVVGRIAASGDAARAFSLFALGFSISGFVGPMIAGYAIDHAGYRIAFWLLAAFPAISTATLVLGARGTSVERRKDGPTPERRLNDLLAEPRMRGVFVVSAILSSGWDLFAFVVPIYAARIGLSASTVGSLVGAFAAATLVVRVVLPRIASRTTEWRILTGVLALVAMVYLLFPLVRSVPLLFALSFVLGLGLGAAQPMVLSLIYAIAPPGRAAEAVGIRSTLINASQTFMPLLFGAVGVALGVLPVFWAMSALTAAGGWFARRR
jgi:predicted MFS family arabinose efflux permease